MSGWLPAVINWCSDRCKITRQVRNPNSRPFTGLTSAPTEIVFGRFFKGKIDELKIFKGRMSTKAIVEGPMWGRGGGASSTSATVASGQVLLGYYRFNTLGSYPGSGADSAGNGRTALAVKVDIVAVAVPWEPASLHSIVGVDSVGDSVTALSATPWWGCTS